MARALAALAAALAACAGGAAAGFDDAGRRGGLSGLRWSDWDGRQTCAPLTFELPRSAEEVAAIVRAAAEHGEPVRVVGAGHSFSAIALQDGARYVSLDRMRQMISVQPLDDPADGALVTVQAGIRLYELNPALERRGLALLNLGATAEQSLAGAISTGTHGTGMPLGSLSTQITALTIVDGRGEIVHASRDHNRDVFDAARVGVGALGIITEITLHVPPLFYLRELTISIEAGELAQVLPTILARHERTQWFYFPYSPKNATLLIRTEVSAAEKAQRPGCWERGVAVRPPRWHAESGGVVVADCVDVAYRALSDSRIAYHHRQLYTEMEMFVPVEKSAAAVANWAEALEELKDQVPADVRESVFTGVRYVAGDDIWLSPQTGGRTNAVISFIVNGSREATGDPAVFELLSRRLEELTSKDFEGVPHWGKQNYATYADLAKRYPKLPEFDALRRRMDPHDLFLNDYLKARIVPPAQDPMVAQVL